jgi:hypothetical protein
METRPLPAAVLSAARDRQGGATEVAARALDGLLEVAGDPPLLEAAVGLLLAGQPAMAPIWHLARAAGAPAPPAALAELRRRRHSDADAAGAAAAAWLTHRQVRRREQVATVSHSSLADRVLAQVDPPSSVRRQADPPASVRRQAPRRGSLTEAAEEVTRPSTAPLVALVGADAVGPEAFLNAAGTAELAARLPTLVVATAVKLVPAGPFARLAGPGFERVPLEAVAAVVVGPEVLSPAEAGRRAAALADGC